MKQIFFDVLIILAIPLALAASEKSIKLPPDNAYARLKPGTNVEVTQSQCGLCHSTDYIVMQPPRDAKQWQAEVTKMLKVYGAPIKDPEAKKIVEYLVSAYGSSSR